VHGTRRTSILLSAFLLFAIPAGASFAEAPASIGQFADKGFPDNADLRGKLFSNVIGASQAGALAFGEKQLQSSGAGPVTVRVEKRSSDFLVEFINQNSATPGMPGRGSCFIQRSAAKGNYILQARILLQDDPSCFLALYPASSGTRGDVVMYGAVVKKGLYFSDMLYRILLLSFSDIVEATNRSFDWGLVFRFDGKGDEAVAELRAPGALARPASEQAAPAAASQAASPAPVAQGYHVSGPRIALAAAPALPAQPAPDALPKARYPRIAAATERAASADALLSDLGDMGAREIGAPSDLVSGYLDSSDSIARLAYAEFPRYDSRGLPLAAVRAAVYADLLDNPDSTYALVGEGFRAVVVPRFDEAGRLGFACFSGGKETSWADLSAGKRDLKLRAVRIPAGS
jgi:hypothetical protein